MNKIIAITVSTNYTDYLKLIIKNHVFFHEGYIITDKNDKETIDFINSKNLNNIKLLFFDFKANGYIFNKGGAIKYAQEIVYTKYKNNENIYVLLLDSDIYLLENKMNQILNFDLKDDVLYGIDRLFCTKYSNFINKNFKNEKLDKCGGIGYFQLYSIKNDNIFYDDYKNASQSDLMFSNKFINKEAILNNFCIHLGRDGVHGDGRIKEKDDFFNN